MRPDDKEQGSNENEENEEPMSSSLSEREECFGPAAETKSPRRLLPGQLPAAYFGAREAMIFSNRGSPRRESQNGISFSSP
jgi:hypothetical protein